MRRHIDQSCGSSPGILRRIASSPFSEPVLRGVAASQTELRADIGKVESRRGVVKISPLADWSKLDAGKECGIHITPSGQVMRQVDVPIRGDPPGNRVISGRRHRTSPPISLTVPFFRGFALTYVISSSEAVRFVHQNLRGLRDHVYEN